MDLVSVPWKTENNIIVTSSKKKLSLIRFAAESAALFARRFDHFIAELCEYEAVVRILVEVDNVEEHNVLEVANPPARDSAGEVRGAATGEY